MENITISRSEYQELLRYKQIVSMVEDELHDKELKEDFVKKTEKIRTQMDQGKKVRFKSVEEMDAYLKKQ